MKIAITQMNLITKEDRRAVGLRASLRICINDAMVIDRCALLERNGNFILKPPFGQSYKDKPIRWVKGSAFETEMLEAALDAYEAMTST